MFWAGIDLGGTAIKAGICDDEGRLLAEVECPTPCRNFDAAAHALAASTAEAAEAVGLAIQDLSALGVGCPGTVAPDGRVIYCNNLGWQNAPLASRLAELTKRPVFAANDATLAALGEVKSGVARGYGCALVLTLGTGIGSGVVIDGRPWNSPWGTPEFGHTVIRVNGRPCTCGRRGCFEAYGSATGLITTSRELLSATFQKSILADAEPLDAKKIFAAADRGDDLACRAVDLFLDDLACGLANGINAFRPQIVGLGGGISKRGEALLAPLRERLAPKIYGAGFCTMPAIEACTLSYRAGMIGAAELARLHLLDR